MDFFLIVIRNFLNLPIVAAIMIGAAVWCGVYVIQAFQQSKTNAIARFAPSIMTATGLLGTFWGLTLGLNDFKIDKPETMGTLVTELKTVFIYSFFGIVSSIIFMVANGLTGRKENALNKKKLEGFEANKKTYNDEFIQHQRNLIKAQKILIDGQKQTNTSLSGLDGLAPLMEKLNQQNDIHALSKAISVGVVDGMRPMMADLREAIAEQGTEAMQKILEDLRQEILVPMSRALDSTNDAVRQTIGAIQESQEQTKKLMVSLDTTTQRMDDVSIRMGNLVDKIDGTVQHMDDIQIRLEASFNTFNEKLSVNFSNLDKNLYDFNHTLFINLTDFNNKLEKSLSTIEPAIVRGLKSAETALVASIDNASARMNETLTIAAVQLVTIVNKMDATVDHMDKIQVEQKESLDNFNKELKINLATIEPAIERGLKNAETALVASIDNASTRMNETLTIAADKLVTIVSEMDETVGNMGEIQKRQEISFNEFNAKLQENLATIEPSIREGLETAQDALVASINNASEKMNETLTIAADKLVTIVSEMDETVGNMGEIQKRQEISFNEFNAKLQENLATIEPSIREGLKTAQDALVASIDNASKRMNETLGQAGEKLNLTIAGAFALFDQAQDKFKQTLDQFSTDMNGHLDRMAGELTAIGENAERMITSASDNLKETLGDIDKKLLDTAEVLKTSLETFRIEYQDRLMQFLTAQNEQMGKFLDGQNEQLEKTIGEQRRGLEAVTLRLQAEFATMCAAQTQLNATQHDLNNTQRGIAQMMSDTENSMLPKVERIALELGKSEERIVQQIELSAEKLASVSASLDTLNTQLPVEFAKHFDGLDVQYKKVFSDMDGGLNEVAAQLVQAAHVLVQANGIASSLK